MSDYLCSYRPLTASASGRKAVAGDGLPPFIDGSCRREPDFQIAMPSISALCRGRNFAPRLRPGDRVAYITVKKKYLGDWNRRLVALMTIEQRFTSHEQAAEWYGSIGSASPSNCMVPGNAPQMYERTNRDPPKEVKQRIDVEKNPEQAIRLWDLGYRARARDYPVFLACRADFLELWCPPVLNCEGIRAIFGRCPCTQNPPKITTNQFEQLAALAAGSMSG
ncbi:MAG TPA: hypothetical protein VGM07_15125 [Stellaceae bacterium]|jgi:hypothetical protein